MARPVPIGFSIKLGLGGLLRRSGGAFVVKTPTTTILGPYDVRAVQFYMPGASAVQLYSPGAHAVQVNT